MVRDAQEILEWLVEERDLDSTSPDENRLITRLIAYIHSSPEPVFEWRDGRMVNPEMSEMICIHHVGITSGTWCGNCNAERYKINPPATGAPKNWPLGYLDCGCRNDGKGHHIYERA